MTKESWILKNRPFSQIQERLRIEPILAKIIANRVEVSEAYNYMHPEEPVTDPFQMLDMDKAVERILKHIQQGDRIDICGDYDVDGLTSTVILGKVFRALGAHFVQHIPDRISDGYGLRVHVIEEAKAGGSALIVTCDNGIAEQEAADKAAELGLDFIVTDHHDIPETLPQAYAIVNPKLAEDHSGCKGLCGAGVAYQLARALMIRAKGSMDPALDQELVGFAALGTVCDVMELTGDNRKIVYQGLQSWNRKRPMLINDLMHFAGLETLNVYSFGFVIGPMLNSSGRLENQQHCLQLLMDEDPQECLKLGEHLYHLNIERQKLMAEGQIIAEEQLVEHEEDKVKVIYLPQVHESLAGLIAGKIREKTGHPVFVITGEEESCKGSGRSIPAYPMSEELNKVSDSLIKFGGHPMAAGLSVLQSRIQEFRKKINEICILEEKDYYTQVQVDQRMSLQYANGMLLDLLEKLEPYGNGNPKPLFAQTGLRLKAVRMLGKNGKAMRLTVEEGSAANTLKNEYQIMLFKVESFREQIVNYGGDELWEHLIHGLPIRQPLFLDLCYAVNWNEWNGRREVQIVAEHFRISAPRG